MNDRNGYLPKVHDRNIYLPKVHDRNLYLFFSLPTFPLEKSVPDVLLQINQVKDSLSCWTKLRCRNIWATFPFSDDKAVSHFLYKLPYRGSECNAIGRHSSEKHDVAVAYIVVQICVKQKTPYRPHASHDFTDLADSILTPLHPAFSKDTIRYTYTFLQRTREREWEGGGARGCVVLRVHVGFYRCPQTVRLWRYCEYLDLFQRTAPFHAQSVTMILKQVTYPALSSRFSQWS